jgi:translation elongation factor EF-1alpha
MAADGGLLAARREKDLLHFLTCGSVDDGKSTLIGRLPIRLSSGDVSERVW